MQLQSIRVTRFKGVVATPAQRLHIKSLVRQYFPKHEQLAELTADPDVYAAREREAIAEYKRRLGVDVSLGNEKNFMTRSMQLSGLDLRSGEVFLENAYPISQS